MCVRGSSTMPVISASRRKRSNAPASRRMPRTSRACRDDDAGELAAFLNQYYEALLDASPAAGRNCVRRRRGLDARDLAGSGAGHAPDRVLNALLELRDAAEDFNVRLAGNRLQTRFGVDWGRVALTTVGAHAHYEYRAVGDAVEHRQAGSRAQQAPRHADPVSAEPFSTGPAAGVLTRSLAARLLRGKSDATRSHELICLEVPGEGGGR
mgnify:CR=1 FL=1